MSDKSAPTVAMVPSSDGTYSMDTDLVPAVPIEEQVQEFLLKTTNVTAAMQKFDMSMAEVLRIFNSRDAKKSVEELTVATGRLTKVRAATRAEEAWNTKMDLMRNEDVDPRLRNEIADSVLKRAEHQEETEEEKGVSKETIRAIAIIERQLS